MARNGGAGNTGENIINITKTWEDDSGKPGIYVHGSEAPWGKFLTRDVIMMHIPGSNATQSKYQEEEIAEKKEGNQVSSNWKDTASKMGSSGHLDKDMYTRWDGDGMSVVRVVWEGEGEWEGNTAREWASLLVNLVWTRVGALNRDVETLRWCCDQW